MVSSAALEVAVALIMIYLVLSIICSGLSQATTQGVRGRVQTAYLLNLFSGSSMTTEEGINTARAFYSHPLVQADIPAMSGPDPTQNPYRGRWWKAPGRAEHIHGRRYATALLDLATDKPKTADRWTLKEGIEHLSNERLSELLRALWESVDGDQERFRAELAALFESGESFVTAWYSRIVRRHQLIWAVAIVALVNIDTLDIAQNVWAQTGESADRVRELPVGWGAAEVGTVGDLASKIAGLLLTVGAITFGSEFWLGLLERLGRAPTTKS